ncbi:MAG TPA: ABC transporter ATP-binding protein [Patescibacteria group bacterium]|nr:ABC transporter ATP-binding protein [Patescibacteria group bacterium]
MEKNTLTKETIRYYWRHARIYPGHLLGLLFSIPLATLFLTFLPPLIISRMLQRISSGDFVHGQIGTFIPGLVGYSIFSILGGVIMWRVAVFFVWKLEMKVLRDIHREVFDHLLSLSANFHSNRFGGSLVSQTNKLASAYVRIADTTLFELSTLILSFGFAFVILAMQVPWIALALLILSIVFMTVAVFATNEVRHLRTLEAAAENKQTGQLADAVTNVMAVKSFAGSGFERKLFHTVTEDTRRATQKVMVSAQKRDTIFSIGTTLIGIVALVLSVMDIVLYSAQLGSVFLVITYTGLIGQRLWDFAQHTLRDYNRALGDAQEMIEILAIEPEVKDSDKPEKVRMNHGAIEFRNTDFTHPDSRDGDVLFSNLNLQIAAGEKIGLVGHSGSGKTTLTRLLLRFNEIDGGEILIDGQNIAAVTQDDLRRHIAYVPQEPLLFHRSIRENIAYGKPGATKAEIEAAAEKAYANEFIAKLPKQYDTLVGERGVKLSGGQRQRIVIARAILKDAPILVLDEATSALDSESEKLIQSALWELMKGRTAIVIAHRLSTIQKMDRILVLSDGDIIEQGTHGNLLKQKGTYAKLWAHQSGGFIED